MRILVLVKTLGIGGMERAAVNLADAFAQYGHESHLLYLKTTGTQIHPEHAKVIQHYFPYTQKLRASGIGLLLDLLSRLLLNPLSRKSHFFWVGGLGGLLLKRHVKKLEEKYGRFDQIIVRGQGTFELLWGWHDERHLFVIESIMLDIGRSFKICIFNRVLFNQRHLVAVSEGVHRSVTEASQRLGWQPDSVQTILNPCPVKRIRELAAEMDADIPAQPYLVSVGRLVPEKDYELLLRAYKQSMAGMPLVIVGDGRLRAHLGQLAVRLGIVDKVIFAGSRINPYPWMKHARCLILSSKFEGLPTVLLEALACGTPILSVDCPGGVRQIFRGELEKYLTEHSVDGLAQGIQLMLAEGCEVNEAWLDDFHPEIIVQRFLSQSGGRCLG